MAAAGGRLPYKAPCSVVATLSHHQLGPQHSAGTRAEGAGPTGRRAVGSARLSLRELTLQLPIQVRTEHS